MLDHAADTALFTADTLAPVDPIAQILASVREPGRFVVSRARSGFVGCWNPALEPSARYTEVTALADLAEAARGLGYDATLYEYDAIVRIAARRPVEAEPHDEDCACCDRDECTDGEQDDRRVA